MSFFLIVGLLGHAMDFVNLGIILSKSYRFRHQCFFLRKSIFKCKPKAIQRTSEYHLTMMNHCLNCYLHALHQRMSSTQPIINTTNILSYTKNIKLKLKESMYKTELYILEKGNYSYCIKTEIYILTEYVFVLLCELP